MLKIFERVLIKIIIIQFVLLVFSQWFIHHLNAFPELQIMIKYEGVHKAELTRILEVFTNL